jgi:drug/metabolite transporter (DMT)-like permease
MLEDRERSMSFARLMILTALALVAFAGNSLLGRIALKQTGIDAASYTTIRLISGAIMLLLLAGFGWARVGRIDTNTNLNHNSGNWWSALALFVYAAGFSSAYLSLSTGTGALLLFGAVQATMIGHGLWRGERLRRRQLVGLVLGLGGLVGLMLPGLAAPPFAGSVLMIIAGVAWGVYSLRGKGAGNPVRVTAGNFLRAAPIAFALSLVLFNQTSLTTAGVIYAIASGALASGIGYAIWYAVLPNLKATTAATVQLAVPVIAALGGIVFLGEPITQRLLLASIAILGGIAMVILEKPFVPKNVAPAEAIRE